MRSSQGVLIARAERSALESPRLSLGYLELTAKDDGEGWGEWRGVVRKDGGEKER